MPEISTASSNSAMPDVGYGAPPEVNEGSMEASNRVVTSPAAAIQLCNTDIQDARKLIVAARRITAKKQGAPPYDPAKLKQQGKAWKRNVSSRALQKELARAAARFYMPVLTASTLTAAELPAGWPRGQEKTKFFRDTITNAIRGWRKNDMYWRGIAIEVCDYGFGFAAWTDPDEWRPHLVRMDRGFIPRGTEVMDENLGRFTLKWDYQPNELLRLVRAATDAGSDNWNKDAVAQAVDAATLPEMPQDMTQLRKWEELIRENSWDWSYSRGVRVIKTWHLFVLEYTGKVSHYILWPDGPTDAQVLFEHLDAYDRTDQVAIPLVFNFGDGTVHGSWGAGQLLYDLAAQVEKIRCDSIDNLLNSNKARLQVPNANDAASAQLVVNDTMIIATGAQFAQNVGGIAGDAKGYMVLDDKMNQWMQEVVGSYLPPVPLGPSDIKAAQVNAAMQKEQEVAKDTLEAWMKQVALVIAEMTRRLCKEGTSDAYAKALQDKLLGNVGEKVPPPPVSLTREEIDLLVNQPVIRSVTEFTEWAATQRGAFAASVQNNPLFNQASVAQYMADGVPSAGPAFASNIVRAEGDVTEITAQQRQQAQENGTMLLGIDVAVVVTDAHQVHLDAMKEPMNQAISAGLIKPAELALKHASAHYAAGLSTKTLSPDTINQWKSQIATWQRALEAKSQEMQQQQQMQQPQGGAMPPPQIPAQ